MDEPDLGSGRQHLVARKVDQCILLEGTGPEGRSYRWEFSGITPARFRWRGYNPAGDGTWFLREEMIVRRQ